MSIKEMSKINNNFYWILFTSFSFLSTTSERITWFWTIFEILANVDIDIVVLLRVPPLGQLYGD